MSSSPPAPSASAVQPSLRRNAMWNWGVYIVNAGVLFALSPFVVRELGTDGYGVWAIVLTLTGYMGFADLGICPAIVHFVARYRALGDREALGRAVSSAVAVFTVGAFLVLGCAACVVPWLPQGFHVPQDLRGDAVGALWISAGVLAATLPLNAWSAILIGRERYDISCRIDLVTVLVRSGAVVGVLLLGMGLVGLALAQGVVELASMGAKVVAARRLEPGVRFSRALVDRSAVKALLAFGAFGMLATAALRLTYETDALVIGGALSLAAVAWFTVASRLPFYLRTMTWSMGRVLAPRMGAIEARGDVARLGRLAARSGRTLLLIAVAPLVYMAVFGGAFLETWMGDAAFRAHAAWPLAILALGAAAPIASHPLVSLHQGTNRMRPLAVLVVCEGLANLGLSLLLVGRFGLMGVAWGTAIPALVVHGLALPIVSARTYHFSFPAYLRYVWGLPLAALLPAAWLPVLVFDPDASLGWVALAAAAALTAALFGGAAWMLHALGRVGTSPVRTAEATS